MNKNLLEIQKDQLWCIYFPKLIVSTGPAAVAGGRSSPPLLAGGGEGDPPLCIGKQEVGTYIYSLLYTHTLGSWDDFFWSLAAVNVKGTSVTTWADERYLRHCLKQFPNTCFGTTASSSSYGETRP